MKNFDYINSIQSRRQRQIIHTLSDKARDLLNKSYPDAWVISGNDVIIKILLNNGARFAQSKIIKVKVKDINKTAQELNNAN